MKNGKHDAHAFTGVSPFYFHDGLTKQIEAPDFLQGRRE
jgi:hypothetical protein